MKLNHLNRQLLYLTLAIMLVLGVISCKPTRYVPDNEYLLNKYKLKCDDKKVDSEELESYVKQQPNRRMLQMFRFHLGVYNSFYTHKAKKWRRKIAEIVGEEPAIFDDYLKDKTVKQFKMYMLNKGYYQADVTDTVIYKKKKANVFYTIHANEPYRFRKFSYKIDDYIIESLVLRDTVNTLLKAGSMFDVDVMQAERERINKMLRNKGYYRFSKEFIYYEVDSSLNSHQVDIAITIKDFSKKTQNENYLNVRHEKYSIDSIFFYMDYDPKLAIKEGLKYAERFDTLYIEGYYFIYQKDLDINPKVILQANYITHNNYYTIYDVERTYSHLMGLRVFKIVNIQFSEHSGENRKYLLNAHIQLSPFNKQSYVVEQEGTNSSGNLGVGGSVKYQHKSLFRNAEIFDFKVHGGLESQTTLQKNETDGDNQEDKSFITYELGVESSINIPKFWFVSNSKNYGFIKKYDPKTSISLAYNFQIRPKYTRTIANLSYGYFWNGSKYIKHIVNPFEVNMVDIPVIDSTFYADITNPYIRNSYKDYLITTTKYSFIFNNQGTKKRKTFTYFRLNLEPSGNILSTINKITKTTNEGGSYLVLNRKHAQYAKADFEYRYYRMISSRNKLVYRVFAGVGIPYGNSIALPFVKQYFSGGANSIRAWPVRSLGPGSYYDPDETFNYQSSDMKLEMNLEYRFKWFWLVEGAFFVDAGNIWAVTKNDTREGALFNTNTFYRDIAIGSGFGMRFDFTFFIFRFDFGVKVRDPRQEAGSKLVIFTNKVDFVDDLFSNINVGIGYPF